MRAHTALILFIVTGISLGPATVAGAQGVNALAGDASWIAAHGRAPTLDDSEPDRIQTHLLWVVDQLSARRASGFDRGAWARRVRLLESLRSYANARRFPRVDRVQRTPRFVDDRGVLCAVGHLIRESGHPELVAAVQRRHEYDRIDDMELPALEEWAARHGFDVTELALIQPGYRVDDPDVPPPVQVHARVSGASAELEVVLRRAIRSRTAPLRECYQRAFPAARADPTRSAQVRLSAQLARDGTLSEVSSARAGDPLVACLTQVLRAVRIPAQETPELPVVGIVIVFGRDDGAELPELNRVALTQLLEQERATIEACARQDHALASVTVRVVVRSAGAARLLSRTEPRSDSAEACIDDALRRVGQRATLEFRVVSTTRARARWRVASRARRRGLGIGDRGDAPGSLGAE